jgi:two-component system alkaline phosphatase synthesis response regulator PhoP
MGKHRILVVDDDRDILELLEYNLVREGFKVRTEENGQLAIDACGEFEPDLIILDIMMPEMNGIEVCKRIRMIDRFRDTFIFFLTAKSESYYQEAALDTGGDDFIEKIIGLRALTGKIKAVLQRKLVIRKRIAEIHVGNLHINRRAGSARIGNKSIPLSKPEFELLFFFAQNPHKIISTDNLLADIWSSETFSLGSSVNGYLELLTQKLGGEWLLRIDEGKYRLLPG